MRTKITKDQLAEWRKYRGVGYTSAIGEYTPSEFWDALDEIDRLNALVNTLLLEKKRKDEHSDG